MEIQTNIDDIKGFVKIIWQQLIPLNDNPKFRSRFRDKDLTFIINITDGDYAAWRDVYILPCDSGMKFGVDYRGNLLSGKEVIL